MMQNKTLSPRLAAIVEALPLRPGLRVLEIGCGPGAAAREIVPQTRSRCDVRLLMAVVEIRRKQCRGMVQELGFPADDDLLFESMLVADATP